MLMSAAVIIKGCVPQYAFSPLRMGRSLLTSRSRRWISSRDGRPDNNPFRRARNIDSSRTMPPRKENFDQRVLQRAAKGELGRKHESGIPRLAARKHKGHLNPISNVARSRLTRTEDGESNSDIQMPEDQEGRKASTLPRRSTRGNAGHYEGLGSSDDFDDELATDQADYLTRFWDDDRYYWREEEFDQFRADDEIESFRDEKGFMPIDYNIEDLEPSLAVGEEIDGIEEDESYDDGTQKKGSRKEPLQGRDPEFHYFYGQEDVMEIAASGNVLDSNLPDVDRDIEMPLRDHGPELDDFLEADMDHPSTFARITRKFPHQDSQREPKPDFPPNRINPTEDFIESFSRFLYVSGLPLLDMDGERGDLNNPVHRSFMQKSIADIFSVDTTHVSLASTTSGFVGFGSPGEMAEALTSPTQTHILNPPFISMSECSSESVEFAKQSPEATVLLSNTPTGNTATSLLRKLFPSGSDLAQYYGNLTSADIYFLSATKVLIRFASKEQAESAVQSQLFKETLQELGTYRLQFFSARRELVHDGFTGPGKFHEKRRPGPRLVVDGDMPSRMFFLSHARLIHVRNLDTSLSKQSISAAFQRFSARIRDVHGSIEFVTCENVFLTGRAYIGFDRPGEAEEAVRALNGRIHLGDRCATLKLVDDRVVPGRPLVRPERRPERTVDLLLQDLNNWERFVAPSDLEELEKAGICKTVLDEALRTIRYQNPTFGPLDSSVRSEALEPNKMSGELYKDIVQLYVSTLKDCIATPENVGELYEAMHLPDEPIDLTIFDREKERQKMLLAKRAGLS